jgi:hypothetical protein
VTSVAAINGVKADSLRGGAPMWTESSAYKVWAIEVLQSENYLTRKAKMMNDDYVKASEIAETADQLFKRNIDKLTVTTDTLQANVKKVSGNVRKAADDLSAGLAKVEKTANFANLEKYVALLERAATAMSTLAELEKAGKLEKIAGALK